jgi:hypothetical protein
VWAGGSRNFREARGRADRDVILYMLRMTPSLAKLGFNLSQSNRTSDNINWATHNHNILSYDNSNLYHPLYAFALALLI